MRRGPAGKNKPNWQTKLSTMVERTTFIFNSQLLGDVKFVVLVSTGESESNKMIPTHKFVLAVSSPFFYILVFLFVSCTRDKQS